MSPKIEKLATTLIFSAQHEFELIEIVANKIRYLNILYQDISRVGALELNFYNKYFDNNYNLQLKKHIDTNKPVVFLMGLDEVDLSVLKNAYVVYLGHHGDQSASVADVILPTPAYTEKTSTYMNIEGRVIQTNKCHNPLGEAKEEWKIFRVLSNLINHQLKFNNLSELRDEITKNFNQFTSINELKPNKNITFAKVNKIDDIKIQYNINNFYMNDSISRSSETMALCTKDILNKAA